MSHPELICRDPLKCGCKSIVLKPNTGTLVQREDALPMADGETTFSSWVHVKDHMDFWNVGFLRDRSEVADGQTRTKKYLICADCEYGPIGVQYIAEPGAPIYVAVDTLTQLPAPNTESATPNT